MCDPFKSELWATLTGLCIDLYGSRSLTARSQKGRTQLKIQPQNSISENVSMLVREFTFLKLLLFVNILYFHPIVLVHAMKSGPIVIKRFCQ
jgi:hypothetical protein